MTDLRVSQYAVETLAAGTAQLRVSQYAVETLVGFPTASGQIANVWFQAGGAFIDLTRTATRQRFFSPSGAGVNPGVNGSGPTGVAPTVFFTGGPSGFATNEGTGGGFSLSSGSFVAPGSAPPCDIQVVYSAGNVPQGADPQVMLSVSDDGGRTWSPLQKWRSMGRIGEYTKRLRWLKMGQFRQRVVKLEITDPVRRRLIGFYEEITEGME